MARIQVVFQFQTHISEKFNIIWADSAARVVYVDLREQEDLYRVPNDKESFEICWLYKNVFSLEACIVREKCMSRL